ncbi:gag-polypeptide of LTR copia-type [Sesbania bispinosa]|nr:gag-polypeptide of LTR copia-type [Sesbania bispinosa]
MTSSPIALNIGTQSSFKLNGTNYPAWRIQLNALLIGHNLKGYADCTNTCPQSNHPDYDTWIRQDKLIIQALVSSVSESVITLLGNVATSKQAWNILENMFANKSRCRVLSLKERLINAQKGLATTSPMTSTIYQFIILI